MKQSFTLIEVLVSIAIFSLVVLVIIGVMLDTLKIRRIALQKSYLYDSGRFVMESIMRELRVGKNIIYSPYQISFDHPDLGQITYAIGNQIITRNGVNMIPNNVKAAGKFITMYDGQFFKQPMVTIVLNLSDPKDIYKVNLQSAVSQRNLNL